MFVASTRFCTEVTVMYFVLFVREIFHALLIKFENKRIKLLIVIGVAWDGADLDAFITFSPLFL